MVVDEFVRQNQNIHHKIVPKKCPKSVQDTSSIANYSGYSGSFKNKKARKQLKFAINGLFKFGAESQGFEPREGLHPRWFSRPVHSTTLPTLRVFIAIFATL